MIGEKRQREQPIADVQSGNLAWWTTNAMTYDWHGEIKAQPLSLAWFNEIDDRFVADASLYATDSRPFDRIIPFGELDGARVLEVGCGMGLHSELMARAGAMVTAADFSPRSCLSTGRRLRLKEINANVVRLDAEELPFPSASFDFVWSWGVIHHSARTTKIVREIARVLGPEGSCRIMVYNRAGTWARVILLRDHILRRGFLERTYDETLYRSSDGFSARFYPRELFEDILRGFFHDVSSEICGQRSDAVPLPRRLRAIALPLLSSDYLRSAQARRGSFLFLTASRPT